MSTARKMIFDDSHEEFDFEYHLQLAEFSRREFEKHNMEFPAYLAGMLVIELQDKIDRQEQGSD